MATNRSRPKPAVPRIVLPVFTILLLAVVACHKQPLAKLAPGTPAVDSSYADLEPGQRLRILVPLLASGTYKPSTEPAQTQGATITLSADNLLGYEVFHYLVRRARSGRVSLRFASAERTRDGKTVQEQHPPALPFSLPAGRQHIRLLYLIRSSRADHNMALLAARNTRTLEALTADIKAHPEACASGRASFCAWIPGGIALRPESDE